MVVLTTNLQFITLMLDDERPVVMADLRLQKLPSSWCVLPNSSGASNVEILVAVNYTILTVDAVQSQDQV